MQRPGYNPSMPGMPMHNGFNSGPPNGFGGPNPGFRPGLPPAGPCFNGPPAPQPMQQQGAGCFMPAATIRKISNTTNPAPFFNQQ